MKAIIAILVLSAAAGLVWALSQDSTPDRVVTAPTVEEPVVVEAQPAELLDVFADEDEELVVEAEVEEDAVGPYAHLDIMKPRRIAQRQLPDGRYEVDILTPVFFGDGRKKNIIRRIQAVPKLWPADRVQQRRMTAADEERMRIKEEQAKAAGGGQ